MKTRSINRHMLLYGVLTLLLSLVYLGCVVISRTLIAPLTGGSELAIVASTLVMVALFNPLRRRLQKLIDTRFARRAEHTPRCWGFGATARSGRVGCTGRQDAP